MDNFSVISSYDRSNLHTVSIRPIVVTIQVEQPIVGISVTHIDIARAEIILQTFYRMNIVFIFL